METEINSTYEAVIFVQAIRRVIIAILIPLIYYLFLSTRPFTYVNEMIPIIFIVISFFSLWKLSFHIKRVYYFSKNMKYNKIDTFIYNFLLVNVLRLLCVYFFFYEGILGIVLSINLIRGSWLMNEIIISLIFMYLAMYIFMIIKQIDSISRVLRATVDIE